MDSRTKAEVTHLIYQEAVFRQGTDVPIQVQYCGETYEGVGHERGAFFSNIEVDGVHKVK